MKQVEDLQIIDVEHLKALLSLSRTSLWRYCRLKILPAPIRLGPNRIGWSRAAIQKFIEDGGFKGLDSQSPRGKARARAQENK